MTQGSEITDGRPAARRSRARSRQVGVALILVAAVFAGAVRDATPVAIAQFDVPVWACIAMAFLLGMAAMWELTWRPKLRARPDAGSLPQ